MSPRGNIRTGILLVAIVLGFAVKAHVATDEATVFATSIEALETGAS